MLDWERAAVPYMPQSLGAPLSHDPRMSPDSLV